MMADQTTTVDINDASQKHPTKDGLDTDEEPAVTSSMLPSSEPRPQPPSTQGEARLHVLCDHFLSWFDSQFLVFIMLVLFFGYLLVIYTCTLHKHPHLFTSSMTQRCDHRIQTKLEPFSLTLTYGNDYQDGVSPPWIFIVSKFSQSTWYTVRFWAFIKNFAKIG